MVRICVVDADMVELRDWQVDHVFPSAAAILAAGEATVVGVEDEVGIVGRDPHIVVVGMGLVGRALEALPAIIAEQQDEVALEDFVLVFGVDDEVSKVERAPDHVLACVHAVPGQAGVVRPIESAGGAFDHCVHNLRVRWRDSESDTPIGLCGKTLCCGLVDLGPVLAFIGGLEHAASSAA